MQIIHQFSIFRQTLSVFSRAAFWGYSNRRHVFKICINSQDTRTKWNQNFYRWKVKYSDRRQVFSVLGDLIAIFNMADDMAY